MKTKREPITRTEMPVTCLPLTSEEIKEAAKSMGVKKYSPSFVQDLCNIDQGARVLLPSEYEEKVKIDVARTETDPDNQDQSFERAMEYHQYIADFLQTVDMSEMPGHSPLERAMNLLKILAKQMESPMDMGGEGAGFGEDSPTLPVFPDMDNQPSGNGVADEVNQFMDMIEDMSEAEASMLRGDSDEDSDLKSDSDSDDDEVEPDDEEESDSESENSDDNSKKKTSKSGKGPLSKLKKKQIALDMTKEQKIWLEISRELESKTKFKVSKSVKFIPDPEGDEVRNRQIKSLNELNRLVKKEFALPKRYLNYRLISHQSPVRERVKREEKKQLLYLLVDCSGSMDNGQRVAKAGGVVFNRLKAVVEGEAELYLRFFDGGLYEEKFVGSEKEAKDLMKVVQNNNYSGGSTSFDTAIRGALERIEEILKEGKSDRPQIVIITDGDDRFSITEKEFKGTILHSFLVDNDNESLRQLAEKTGGIGICL